MRFMDERYSLSEHHYHDIDAWLREPPKDCKEEQIALGGRLREEVILDRYNGERIHMSTPMAVHIRSSTDKSKSMPVEAYHCMNVTITNHGVYVIDDLENSFEMDPD